MAKDIPFETKEINTKHDTVNEAKKCNKTHICQSKSKDTIINLTWNFLKYKFQFT